MGLFARFSILTPVQMELIGHNSLAPVIDVNVLHSLLSRLPLGAPRLAPLSSCPIIAPSERLAISMLFSRAAFLFGETFRQEF